jgi:hypothetical protein
MPNVAGAVSFYRSVLRALKQRDVPFLVGGAFAMARYTQIDRPTKDLDLMVRRAHWPAVARALRQAGIYTRLSFPHWLGKALAGPAQVLGFDVGLAPPEELVWSKSFLMERERFDGADVLHLILRAGPTFDWDHLCDRFFGHERVLLAHLVLFSYAYPNETGIVPRGVMKRLSAAPNRRGMTGVRLCRGTFLSREQYLVDVRQWGYRDARLAPLGTLSRGEVDQWTRAIHAHWSRRRKHD